MEENLNRGSPCKGNGGNAIKPYKTLDNISFVN